MSTASLYHEALPGQGPCAFFLHGMLSSRLQWQPNLPALSRCVRPVVFDLWGHGNSPAPADDADYTVEAYLAQFESVRERMGVAQVVLVGQSFGAGLFMQYALRHPKRVRGLVFTNAVSALTDLDDEGARNSRERMAREIEAGGAAAIRALPMHPRGGKRLPTGLKDALVAAADAVDPDAVVRAMRITAPQISAAHALGRIECPVLLANGRYESSFQKYRDLAARTIPDCQVVDLEGGHAVNLEAVEGFDAAVIDFVARLPHPNP